MRKAGFNWTTAITLTMLVVMAGAARGVSINGLDGSKYYTVMPLFSPFPDESKPVQSIDRFGPVGIGIDLLQPAFKMRIKNVEAGSPAEAAGQLKKGQLIDSINGQTLHDIDPRIILGDIIAKAEATNGEVKLLVRDSAKSEPVEVVVKIPVLGAYGKTWPLHDEKSDKVVRGMADFVAKHGPGQMGLGTLFLLSTGEAKDLEVVRGWMHKIAEDNKNKNEISTAPWFIGYGGPALCEYYLRTGDESILHTIELYADYLRRNMYNDAWGGRGGVPFGYMAGGHMNAAGVHCLTFLLLAKECGVDVDDYTLQHALRHFFRYAGRGNTSYGDGLPENGFVDNGKVGGLTFAMAAAASLTPDGDNSVYAHARDISAMKSFYSTSWMLHGHTGGGIGEIWRGAAMAFIYDKKPDKYRSFMDNRAWFYDLSRRFDGSFGIVGGERYDDPDNWGIGMGLVYTLPRKTLRLTGAAPTQYAHTYKLPDRPWGTAADDLFYALTPAQFGDKVQDVDSETLADGASWPILRILRDPNVSDDKLLMYAHHPEYGVREMAAGSIRSMERDGLIVKLLQDPDPRARQAGVMAICIDGFSTSRMPAERLTDQMVELLCKMIEDPNESWWAVEDAMMVLHDAKPELIAPHEDRLVHWLQSDDWWMRRAALTALTQVAVDKRYYKQIMPIIGKMIETNHRAAALAPVYGIVDALKDADPEVQKFAVETLGSAYINFPSTMAAHGGVDMSGAVDVLLRSQARALSQAPGGYDALYAVGKKRFPNDILPNKDLFLRADDSELCPTVKAALKPAILEYLIPRFIGQNRQALLQEASSDTAFKASYYRREPAMEELVKLYERAGIDDYDWHDFGPAYDKMAWDYFSFDPPEKKDPDTGTRYRKVTYPKGMADWFAVDFDPRKAGWQTGLQPFGQSHGKLVTDAGPCRLDFCRCGTPMQTLWQHEVLLIRGKFTFPQFQDGRRYRLVVGGMSHVFAGEGFRIYFNGKQMMERERGVGKREGAKPIAYWIDKSWWPAFDQPVTIAATTFLKMQQHPRSADTFMIWMHEMKVPPVSEEQIIHSATVVPMLSASWQALQDPDDMELDPDQGRFLWDGKFETNNAVVGRWTQLGQVASIEEFQPGKRIQSRKNWPLQELEIKAGGRTDDPLFIWTGDTLMDLDRNQALKLTVTTIDGTEYLFIEAGGFNAKSGQNWKCPLYVMKRK